MNIKMKTVATETKSMAIVKALRETRVALQRHKGKGISLSSGALENLLNTLEAAEKSLPRRIAILSEELRKARHLQSVASRNIIQKDSAKANVLNFPISWSHSSLSSEV